MRMRKKLNSLGKSIGFFFCLLFLFALTSLWADDIPLGGIDLSNKPTHFTPIKLDLVFGQ